MRAALPLLAGWLSCASVPAEPVSQPPQIGPITTPSVVQTGFSAGGLGAIPQVAENAVRAVVNVSTRRTTMPQSTHPFGDDQLLQRFFGAPPGQLTPRPRVQEGVGSGVVIDASRGIVVTNNHVADGADEVEVSLSDGRKLEAEVVGQDARSDLAVLRLKDPPEDLLQLPVGDSDALRLGEVVLAIGNPFGVGQTVTMGIVSAKGRANMGIVDYEDFVQTDAAINPGNSGGALVNLRGELVGINTAILSRSGGYDGIGLSIPTAMMGPIVESILDDGAVRRGYLGVMIQDLSPDLKDALRLEVARGVVVSDVVDGSPAAQAGLKRGDVIVRLGERPVESTTRFRSDIAAMGPEASFEVVIERGGKRRTLQGALDLLPGTEGSALSTSDVAALLTGIELRRLGPEERARLDIPREVSGALVHRVARDSAAHRAGMRAGDVIVEVNRSAVRSPEDVREAAEDADGKLLLLLYRHGATRFAVVG